MTGALFLVPVPIGNGLPVSELAPLVVESIKPIRDFVVENRRSALRVLSRILDPAALQETRLLELSEHTPDSDIPDLLLSLHAGRDTALLSEAGSPCIADPGARLVQAAHAAGIKVHPLPGPVSMMLALMASGFNGQNFSFCGYLPVEAAERRQTLQCLEARSAANNESCIFIETPYRNDALIKTALDCLRPDTRLCVAAGISGPEESIVSKSVVEWRRLDWLPGKIPAVFVMAAAGGAVPKGPAPVKAAGRGQITAKRSQKTGRGRVPGKSRPEGGKAGTRQSAQGPQKPQKPHRQS